jgi:hypothetical protein|uniref:Ribosomal RNA methyltransferase FtsJ domain-containing protein n=1 Tax=viral metagenome TaxID=1070528 RepID=A0A6C0IQE7_9ZZZZ
MSFILPSNKFEILISPIIELNNHDSYYNTIKPTPSYEGVLYEKLKNNYKSFFNDAKCDWYEKDNIEEQLSFLYNNTMDDTKITNDNYDNSMFYEMNEFIIKHNIFKHNIFKKNNVFIISKYTNEILDAIKQNNIEYEKYFSFNSYDDNFSENIRPKEDIFEFMIFDILLEKDFFYKNLVTSIMIILNYLKKNGKCIFKIDFEIYSKISEFIYFLSYLFENISIVQLECSNGISLYIQCNDFIINENRTDNYNKNIIMFFFLLNKLKSKEENKFISLFQTGVPYFFNSKLKNVKNIILQQKMEIIYNLNNYFYSNNKFNINENENENENEFFLQKLKQINKQKIKKTISWCKKYNISYSG